LKKPDIFQELPQVPNWDKEKNETVEWEGLPPLKGWKNGGSVRLIGVKSVVGLQNPRFGSEDHDDEITELSFDEGRTILVQNGKITCVENIRGECSRSTVVTPDEDEQETLIDLQGGSVALGLTTYGSPLGLVEIRLEPSTNDGEILDPLVDGNLPALLAGGKESGVVRAVDGLMFEGRNTL